LIFIKQKKQKELKYEQIAEWLRKNGINAIFVHINIQSSYSNLLQELEKIKKYQIKEFDHNNFFRAVDIIEDKKRWVSENIDKEVFENRKIKEIAKENNSEQNEINFQDSIKYENIGVYDDLDIDLDLFQKYNNNYNNVDQIQESSRSFNEEELIMYLGNILETKNDIYKKYKDETLTKNQFDDAYLDILEKNKNYEKRQPKPTHHLLIPFADDLDNDDNEKKKNKI